MTQWSTRRLGTQLKVSHMMVARVWAKHGLKPQRLDRYMAANDPDFEQKAPDIIGLYLNLPAHAAVFCVDEKTAIQALDRKDPVLPLAPGRVKNAFKWFRSASSTCGWYFTHAAPTNAKITTTKALRVTRHDILPKR